jgi:hypothetical protein
MGARGIMAPELAEPPDEPHARPGVRCSTSRAETRVERIARAARSFAPQLKVLLLPLWRHCLPYDRASPSCGTMGRRMEVLDRLAAPSAPPRRLVVAALEAVLQRLRPRQPQHTERLGTPAGDQGVVPGSAEFVNESDVGNDPLDALSPHRIADQTGVAHVPGDHGQAARQAREGRLRDPGQRSVAQDTTLSPRASSASTRLRPTKPVPPVTRIAIAYRPPMLFGDAVGHRECRPPPQSCRKEAPPCQRSSTSGSSA